MSRTSRAWASRWAGTRSRYCARSSPACAYRPRRTCEATPTAAPARAAGIVIGRQRPDTASAVVFVTLEDEIGSINVIVWRDLGDRQRRELLGSRLMDVYGVLEREGEVVHLIATRLVRSLRSARGAAEETREAGIFTDPYRSGAFTSASPQRRTDYDIYPFTTRNAAR